MTEEITRIRAALAAYQAATTLAETLDAVGEFEDACSADVMPAVLSHIDSMQAEIERLNADRRVLQATGEHPAPCARHCEAQAFKIEIRGLKADAARYQWLRKTTNWVSSKGVRIDVRNSPDLWDESIDATMKETPCKN